MPKRKGKAAKRAAKERAARDRREAEEAAARKKSEKERRAAEVKAWREAKAAKAKAEREKEYARQRLEDQQRRDAYRELVKGVFRSYDTNADGTIGREELGKVLLATGAALTDEEALKLLGSMDTNEDGAIDWNEFVCWMFEQGEAQKELMKSEELELDMKAEHFLFLLSDQRLDLEAWKEEDPDVGSLLEATSSVVVPGEDAKHPQRAEAGHLLMQHTNEWLRPSGIQSSLDEEIIEHLFLDSLPDEEVDIESVDQVGDPALLKQFLRKVVEDRSAVTATFHGTVESSVEAILEAGLDTGLCHRGLYGVGAYVAVHAGLAHKYTVASHGGRRRMFCVLCDSGKLQQGARDRRHDTTTVDNLDNPEQLCFVEEDRLFISHLITYRLIGTGVNFAAELRKAIERTLGQKQHYGVD